MKSEFSKYSEDLPGTWSRAIPGGQFQGEGPLGIAVQVHAGELVLHGHTNGQPVLLEYGRAGAGGVVAAAGRVVPYDLNGDQPRAWRNLRFARSDIPADATAVSRSSVHSSR